MDATPGATIVASVINSTSLNCRTSSSSSSSSGYASGHSAASTPATPMSSHYDTTTHTTLTAVSSAEHVPTATVAPVTPFYSETTLGQQQQQRQQYYQSYPYTNNTAQYNPVYDAYTGNSYHNLTTPSIERGLGASNGSHNNSQQRLEKQNKTLASHNTSGSLSQHYSTTLSVNSTSTTTTTTTCATTKPQATATPFFAQPSTNVNTSATTYYDAYGKYKMSSGTKLPSQAAPDYATNYTNHLQQAAAAAATFSYQQQQQHYYAAKSQLQDVNYAAAVVKPHRQHNVGNSTGYYGGSSAYYDKYLYAPTANAAAYSTAVPTHVPAPHPYSPHEPTTADPYRKAAAAAAANAWHWNMEYAAATAGNCRNLPPNANGAYISTPGGNNSGRDTFCAAPANKYSKYDKYGAYYANHHHPQQYMTPSTHSTVSGSTASSRNLWPNSPHHTSHLTPVPAVINERLPHTLPPSATQHQYAHTHTHAHANTHHPFGATASTTTQRQNCCTQPFQQQACYYPRPTQQYPHVAAPNAYASTQPTHYNVGSSGGGSHKYAAYGSSYKPSNNNDLYLTSPFDTPPAAYNYGSASSTAMQQRYGGVAATGAAFYNDLNVQSAFENYASNTISQSTMLQPHIAGAHNVAAHHPTHHLSYQTHGSSQNNNTAAALIEYRKPISAATNDCCMSSTRVSLTNLEQHVANTPSYLTYDIHGNPVAQAHAVITSPTIYSDGGSSSEKSTPTTKNLSLRDFLSTWNEEEEEDPNNANEQLSFINENVEKANYVTQTVSEVATMPPAATPQPNQLQSEQQQQQQHVAEQQFETFKNSYQARPKIHVGITVDGTMDVEASQYMNLPDIIIDIEKSNNVGTSNIESTPTPTVEAVVESTLHHSPCDAHDMFENFDVEKELDELQIKRAKLCLEKQLNNEIRILTPEPTEILSQEIVDTEQTIAQCNEEQRFPNTLTVQHTECEKSYDNAENYLKDIELNDNNSHSSNSSTFEKEYETFINRIDLDKVCVEREQNMRKEPVIVTHHSTFMNYDGESVSRQSSDIKTPPDPVLSEETTLDETTQNQQDFTMFYKKKRKLLKDIDYELSQPLFKQLKADEVFVNDEPSKAVEVVPELVSNEKTTNNIVQKPSKNATKNFNIKSRRRAYSQFFKLLKRGRVKLNTTKLVQKHIAKLKERHLPLIKRQSFKNYRTSDKIIYNPRSLMQLAVSVVNTNTFQRLLLDEREKAPQKNCLQKVIASQDCQFLAAENTIKGSISGSKAQSNLSNMEPSSIKLTGKTIQPIGDDQKNSENLKETLEEHSSNSNSLNGTVSLKEDFVGFGNNQTSRIIPYKDATPNSVELDSNNIETAKVDLNTNVIETASNESFPNFVRRNSESTVNKERVYSEFESALEGRKEKEKTYLAYENNSEKSNELETNFQNSNSEKINNTGTFEHNKTNYKNEEVVYVSNLKSTEAIDEIRKSKNIENHTEVTEVSCQTVVAENEHDLQSTKKHNISSYERSAESFVELDQRQQVDELEVQCSPLASDSANQTQALPAMRTKASVKMCDFGNIQRGHNSAKNRSKSVSPTSSKSKFEFNNWHKPTHHVVDSVEKIDKTKFVEKWAESVGIGGVADISMNVTETILSTQHKIEEALDLSSSSRRTEKPTPIQIDEDSNSSTTTSSSSSSSDSRSDNKSASSTTSSSSTSTSSSSTSTTTSSNSTKSVVTTNNNNHNSTDASEFNELKALERELSQHKNSSDWAQTETVKIANDATDSQGSNILNVKKTDDKQNAVNIKVEAQDIADLKKILESDQDESTEIDIAAQCKTVTDTDMKPCMDAALSIVAPAVASLKNITEAFIINQALKLKDNDNSKNNNKNVEYQNQQNQQNQQYQYVAIPKLSDLCKIALNSSFAIKNLNINENETNILDVVMPKKDKPIPPSSPKSPKSQATIVAENTTHQTNSLSPPTVENFDERRELTVEEALAEMYRQVGVMSDPEDNADDNLLNSDNGENQAQDFLLINLAEILENNDSENNVFVLQCDMNENVLRVMTTTTTTTTENSVAVDSNEVNAGDNNLSALQLVQLLNSNDLEIISDNNTEDNMPETETVSETEPALLPASHAIENLSEDSYSAFIDLPFIHHEEIVPDNYKKFEKEQFLKYLHAKYVQKNVQKFHHANRILKKYRRRFIATKKSSKYMEVAQRSRL